MHYPSIFECGEITNPNAGRAKNFMVQSIGQARVALLNVLVRSETKFNIAHNYTDITGDLQQAMETYQLWSSLYPRDWGPLNDLANLYDLVGKPDQSLEYARMALQVNPDNTLSITTLAQAYREH